jgi:hypothetical protein
LILVLALKYFSTEGREFKETYGLVWLVVLLAAPFFVILAFSFIPTLLRARRESRLKRAVITGDVRFRPGYFRLTPYGRVDRSTFKRLDAADDAIFNWLTTTQESLLYLSGASGAPANPRSWRRVLRQGFLILDGRSSRRGFSVSLSSTSAVS